MTAVLTAPVSQPLAPLALPLSTPADPNNGPQEKNLSISRTNKDLQTSLSPAVKQNETKCNIPNPVSPQQLFSLTAAQGRAIEMLLQGKSEAWIIRRLNISRTTLYRWRTLHPAFMSEFNARRQQLWEHNAQRLRALMGRSLRAMEKALASDDPELCFRAAKAVLSQTADKAFTPPPPCAEHPMQYIDGLALSHRAQAYGDPNLPVTPKERAKAIAVVVNALNAPENEIPACPQIPSRPTTPRVTNHEPQATPPTTKESSTNNLSISRAGDPCFQCLAPLCGITYLLTAPNH